MKKKLMVFLVVGGCIASMLVGCGKDEIEIQSRTEENIVINGNDISYNPEEDTGETPETGSQMQVSENIQTMHAGTETENNGSGENGSMFKFGVDGIGNEVEEEDGRDEETETIIPENEQ